MNGLTGIKIEARGFVGTLNLRGDYTKTNRKRAVFDLACGKPSTQDNKFATWLHCIAYDEVAGAIGVIRPGLLVEITSNFVITEGVLDTAGKQVFQNDKPVTRQWVICESARIIEREKDGAKQLLLVVGQASR